MSWNVINLKLSTHRNSKDKSVSLLSDFQSDTASW